jgi:GGDEF domain-containing protein
MATTTRRTRRFALPSLKDERSEQAIEAFLGEGPQAPTRRRRKAVAAKSAVVPHTGEAVALRTMPGRVAWQEALTRESTRSTRYGRPSAVAIFELRPLRDSATIDSWVRLHATPVGQVLLHLSRATDVVARVADTRFQVLLPETNEPGAGQFVERVVAECHEQLRAAGAPLQVKASIAAASTDLPLHDALAKALSALEAA